MSHARRDLLNSISSLEAALMLDPVSSGNGPTDYTSGIAILRRGMFIAALISFESFVRGRTEELLNEMSQWPAGFGDLPSKFRDAAILHSLGHIQKYAQMLKRQEADYETMLIEEIDLLSSNKGPIFGFSKFFVGDFTGNISDQNISNLAALFQLEKCWESYGNFASEIGFGFPSIKEALNDLIRKRHRSAHSAGYIPTVTDIQGLSNKLICFGVCMDVSMTASVTFALYDWQKWCSNPIKWREQVDLYFLDAAKNTFKLLKSTGTRPLKIIEKPNDAFNHIRSPSSGRVSVVVQRNASKLPVSWSIYKQ